MSKPTIHWRTEWSNGSPTFIVTLTDITPEQRAELEHIADKEGINRVGERWQLIDGAKLSRLFQRARAEGFDLDFGADMKDAPFDLQRLHLSDETRGRLERTEGFRLDELAGYCPVQAEGEVDAQYFYFRARGSHWRIEVGGSASGSVGASWWFEEYWPNSTGFEAGYMTDEDAIRSILNSVERYRTEDRGRFERGHPDYAQTTLEGWSLGALTLRQATDRLGISGLEVIEKARQHGIEIPYLAELELRALTSDLKTASDFDEREVNSHEMRGQEE